MKKRHFCVVTRDQSGFGWGVRLLAEGESVTMVTLPAEDEEDLSGFDQVGEDVVEKIDTLKKAVKQYPDAYYLFDTNDHSDLSEQLRKSGKKVFGASALSARMEHDRAFGMETAAAAGLSLPTMEDCATLKDGLSFLEANADRAYVFKPNNVPNAHDLTFVPDHDDPAAANHELQVYLKHFEVPLPDGFVLQERKTGVEVNFELWLHEGVPIFALCGFETKRMSNRDLGEHVGCSSDVVFSVPVNSPGIRATVGKMLPFYQAAKYTGFADVNVIIADREVWFLEVCNRFGYSWHPNVFLSCAIDGFGALMADWIDGDVDGFANRFRAGFGASVNLHIAHARRGLPLTLTPRAVPFYYPYDYYREGEDLLLAGYSNDVGVFCQHGYTIEDAAEACLNELHVAEAVSFPNIDYRTDLGRRDFRQAPLKRYEALRALGLVS